MATSQQDKLEEIERRCGPRPVHPMEVAPSSREKHYEALSAWMLCAERPVSEASGDDERRSSGNTGTLIMLGLVGVAAYFVWASPKSKRKRA